MADPDSLLGKTLGPCRLDALIGRGGMGRVYKARHLALDRACAVKLVDEGAAAGVDGALVRQQVLDEARAAAKLEDPRIVAVYEVGEAAGIPYIVMQWVDGESLEARVKRQGRLAPQEALEIIRETASALGAAHKAGLVHRDVKPGNILIDSRGAVKLTDFGIAKSTNAASAAGEAIAGSFHFMAPEQAYGGPPDPRSDLYALGATWYYALTAQPPYPGSSMDALVRHRDEAVPEVRLLRPEVTERAAGLLRRLMGKKPEERPASAQALLAEMLSVGMLLDTDTSGSPFKILPAAPRVAPPPAPTPAPAAKPAAPSPADPPAARAVAPSGAAVRPPPPAPPPAAALGSKGTFVALLAGFGVLAFGWQWRKADANDWAAGAALLPLVPAALTVGARFGTARRIASVLAVACAAACWAKYAFAGGLRAAELEPMIAAGLGACALFGSAYLGQWGQDRSEALLARGLSPLAAACLLVSALVWGAPESMGFGEAVSSRGAAWQTAFSDSGGWWRWLGTAGVLGAMIAAAHLNIKPVDEAPKDRRLNWNK